MANRLVRLGGDQVQEEGVDVILGQEPEAPGPTISPYGFHLWRNRVEITPVSEWDATWREAIGGVSEATVTVQNREGVPELDFLVPSDPALTRDIMKMTYGAGNIETDWCLWEGECVTPDLDLPVGFPWRRWKLGCTDWNTVPDLRLLGAPDGQFWAGEDTDKASGEPGGPYPVDGDALTRGTDRLTIQAWYIAKVLAPDGFPFDVNEFVYEYIDDEILFDAMTGQPHLVPSAGPLTGAISALSALASFPIYDWIDPDRKVHHVAYDGPDGYLGLPRAPVAITDVRAEWNGTSKIGGRGLRITPDLTYGPEESYVQGVTPFVMLAADDPDIGFYGGRIIFQGTGWGGSALAGPSGHTASKRQMVVSGTTVTTADRDNLAATYTAFGSRPRYRGVITVGGRDDEGNGLPIVTGFRAGQLLTITDERLPDDINDREWPIQALNGSLSAGDSDILRLGIEFGDGQIERFSAQSRVSRKGPALSLLPAQPAPRHAILFETLNPKPGEVQILTSQALDYADQPLRAAGIQVHWEFVAVTNVAGDDLSGNGETLSPTDSVTNQDGKAITTFTAGTETGVWYAIEASTPVQLS